MIPQGRFAGQPFRLFPWQKRFLRGAFGQPDDAALTLGRGGGKTTFIAAIGATCVDGPMVEPNSESLIVASSFDQGLIAWRHVLRLLGPVLDRDGVGTHKRFRLQDSANRATLTDTRTGAMLKVQGSDPRRLHGAAPRLLIGDELAQWPPAQIEAMLVALETSRGKIEDSRALWIGTRPAGAEHPFERYLLGGVGYSQIHAAGPGDPPFQRRTWKKANPGLDHLPDLEAAIRREAAAAKRDPARLAAFKALRLNLGISDVERQHLLPVEVWRGIEGKADRDGPCFWGVDLGTSGGACGRGMMRRRRESLPWGWQNGNRCANRSWRHGNVRQTESSVDRHPRLGIPCSRGDFFLRFGRGPCGQSVVGHLAVDTRVGRRWPQSVCDAPQVRAAQVRAVGQPIASRFSVPVFVGPTGLGSNANGACFINMRRGTVDEGGYPVVWMAPRLVCQACCASWR